MTKIPFDRQELIPVKTMDSPLPGAPLIYFLNTPISMKENFRRFINHENPLWRPHSQEIVPIEPYCVPETRVRGMITTHKPVDPATYGGKDMFGIEWEYVPKVRGSMVRPGDPHVPDLEHWEDYVTFPDIDSWDWAGAAADTEEFRSDGRVVQMTIYTGLFERLISFVDMTNAMIGMIDEDTKPAIHRLFSRLCDLYDKILAKYKEYFDADMVWFHDDWGSQRAPFFSLDTVREMLVPYLKRCVDSAHKYGIVFQFHSCGKIEMLAPAMVEAGIDIWNGQPINDKKYVMEQYPSIVCDSTPEEFPADTSPVEKMRVYKRYMADFSNLHTYTGRHYGADADEYLYLYELSRREFSEKH